MLLVMAAHFYQFVRPAAWIDGMLLLPAGAAWIGVDLFFVLSGFLITGILLESKGRPGYFRVFYIRRALRILPLYYGALTIYFSLPLLGVVIEPRSGPEYYVFHLSNWVTAFENWPDRLAVHLWSLAIEEQFYLVWPVVVAVLSRRSLFRLCAGLLIISPLIRVCVWIAMPGAAHRAIYVMTITRLDSLVAGAVVALHFAGSPQGVSPRWTRPVCAVTGLLIGATAACGGMRLAESGSMLEVVLGYSVVAVFGGSLLACSLGNGRLARCFSFRPLMSLGHYSYAIYIFHMWAAACVRALQWHPSSFAPPWGSYVPSLLLYCAVMTGVVFVLALISWHIWEKHWMRMRSRFVYGPAEQTRWRGATETELTPVRL